MYKKLILFLLIILMGIPFVISASPFKTSPSTVGCEISPIVRESLKAGQSFDFNFHVFNLTNGMPVDNLRFGCVFHFYNQTGDHTFAIHVPHDPASEHLVTNEWAVRMNGKNISSIGTYAYIIQCNSTVSGCADKGQFIVTNSGFDASSGRALFDVGLLFILAMFFIVCVFLFINSEGLLGKVSSVGIAYLLLIAITFISWQMANDFLLSAQFLVSALRIFFFVLVIGFFPLVIGGFAWYVLMLFKIKEIERLMTKGFSMDEARRRSSK